ncbi:TrmH family RNA methyltransferase [Branchiibius sp. NY16-3462-2]|uniref:TrmH family RNA methyltransferase n=1 Tax=Branchiibius sp. NY16-3462-2 TaxID=1807500 RepID=UPI0025C2E9D6|nr:TrmH family RNA methyltransferase [Branchiibius sp. NY16-3462-2]
MAVTRVRSRNATFQYWQTLLTNRTKRGRARELVVQGVRPTDLALAAGTPIRSLLVADGGTRSRWAQEVADRACAAGAAEYLLEPALLAELGEQEDRTPELLITVEIPPDDSRRIPIAPDLLAVALDRPASPGNVGSIIRSADAFDAHGVLITGHGADPYDPRAVRASTGSVFTVPSVRLAGPADAMAWVTSVRDSGVPVQVVGTDETGTDSIDRIDLTRPTLIVTGTEKTGMAAGWREACDVIAKIPIGGHASSLNAANATSIVLYEAARQRG